MPEATREERAIVRSFIQARFGERLSCSRGTECEHDPCPLCDVWDEYDLWWPDTTPRAAADAPREGGDRG